MARTSGHDGSTPHTTLSHRTTFRAPAVLGLMHIGCAISHVVASGRRPASWMASRNGLTAAKKLPRRGTDRNSAKFLAPNATTLDRRTVRGACTHSKSWE